MIKGSCKNCLSLWQREVSREYPIMGEEWLALEEDVLLI